MLEVFKPTFMLNSIYNLTVPQLKRLDIKTILTDLDNTLLPWNNKAAVPTISKWYQPLKAAGIEVIVLSNNNHQRVKAALDGTHVPFIARAMKPTVTGIKRAIKIHHLDPRQTVMVGDQLITDMAAGNLAGLRTILVKPLVASDGWNTSINRFLEKFIFHYLKHHFINMTWQTSLIEPKITKK